jgi:hypothetical protein
MITLPADVHRCPGSGSDEEGWREGCEACLRRTSPPADPERVWMMQPPAIIAFWCEYEIPPDASPKTGGPEG